MGKLLQLANGAAYDGEGNVIPFMTENWMHLRKSWKHPEAIRSWCSTTSAMIMTG